jgi:hypothetical protein
LALKFYAYVEMKLGIFVRKLETKRKIGRPSCRLEDFTEIDIKERVGGCGFDLLGSE